MCSRFTLSNPESMSSLIEICEVRMFPRYNIAPSQKVSVVFADPDSYQRQLAFMRWGLIPEWMTGTNPGKGWINARSETADIKPAFRRAFRSRRCLIPADGFYEWKRQSKERQPIYYSLKEREIFAFAGLWDRWRGPNGLSLDSCTILTTKPNEVVAPVHNRMPVILGSTQRESWIDPSTSLLQARKLLAPYPSENMDSYPVSTLVNKPENDYPACINTFQSIQPAMLF